MNDEKSCFDIKKRTYIFGLNIIKLSEKFSIKVATPILQKQIIRSATSIGANLVEGSYGSSKKDFQNFVSHAIKSTHETTYWLQLTKDLNLSNKAEIEKMIQESIEIRKILTTILLNSKRNS